MRFALLTSTQSKGVGSMRLEFFILVQLVSGFMGFLLGKAVSEHDNRRNKRGFPDDSDMRTYVFKRDRSRGSNNRRIIQVDEEGREIE